MAYTTILAAFALWDAIDRHLTGSYPKNYRSYPLPTPEERRYDVSDISIVAPTTDWDDLFQTNVRSWLQNRPREILIVTTEREADKARELVNAPAIQKLVSDKTQVRVLELSYANKRDQLMVGINAASGSIIALVDDDGLYSSANVLTHLLAPFHDDRVGLVGGPITSHVPKHRKDADVITPWEAGALRLRQKRDNSIKGAFAGDGGINFCVSGVTMLLRAEILQDSQFQHAFTNEYFLGERQSSGDDTFITRWVLLGHLMPGRRYTQTWRLGMQLTREAKISTSLQTDSRFAGQMKRWLRSGLRHRLTCLVYEPGFWAMYRAYPCMARKILEGLVNPVFFLIRAFVWLKVLLGESPLFALLMLFFELYRWARAILGYVREFPYCRHYVWAAMLADRLHLVSDWYCWLTLGSESWMTMRGAQ